MRTMDVWYAHLSEQELMAAMDRLVAAQKDKKQKSVATKGAKTARKTAVKARTRDSLQALSKLAEIVDGRYRIISQPPIIDPGAGVPSQLRDLLRSAAGR